MANKPTDYQTKSKEPFEVPAPPDLPKAIPTPLLEDADHLSPEEHVSFPEPKTLRGVFRYMGDCGDRLGIDFYGVYFERRQWVEVFDPWIAKKCRTNGDFDTKGKDQENEAKARKRAQAEPDRQEYIRQQDARLRRSNKNADTVMGNT